MDRQTLCLIPLILIVQRIRIIFGMAGDKNLPSAVRRYGIDPCVVAFCKNFKGRRFFNLFADYGRIAGMRYPEYIVKPAKQDRAFVCDPVRKNAEQLLRQRFFLDPVVVIHTVPPARPSRYERCCTHVICSIP